MEINELASVGKEELYDADTFYGSGVGPYEEYIRIFGGGCEEETIEIPLLGTGKDRQESWSHLMEEDGYLLGSGTCTAYEWNRYRYSLSRHTLEYDEIQQYQSSTSIQALFKGYMARQRYTLHMDKVRCLQGCLAALLQARRIWAHKERCTAIQGALRGYLQSCRVKQELRELQQSMEEDSPVLSEVEEEAEDSPVLSEIEEESCIAKAFKRLQNIESKSLHHSSAAKSKENQSPPTPPTKSSTITWKDSLELSSTKLLSPCTTRKPVKSILKKTSTVRRNNANSTTNGNQYNFRFSRRLHNINVSGGAKRVKR